MKDIPLTPMERLLLERMHASYGNIIMWMEKTDSIFPRAHEQSKLNTIIRLKFYKKHYPSEYKSAISYLFNN